MWLIWNRLWLALIGWIIALVALDLVLRASDFRGTGDRKGSTQVLPTLMAGEADLRVGLASANQNIRREL